MATLTQRQRDTLRACPSWMDAAESLFVVAERVYPQATHARTWNYSGHGGPPGWSMPLTRMLSRLESLGLVEWREGRGRVKRTIAGDAEIGAVKP